MYRLSAKLLVTIYGLSEGGQSAILPGAETIRGYGVAVSFVPPARRRVLPPSMPQGVDLETEVALPGRAGQVGQCVTAYVGVEPHAQIAPGVAGPVGGVVQTLYEFVLGFERGGLRLEGLLQEHQIVLGLKVAPVGLDRGLLPASRQVEVAPAHEESLPVKLLRGAVVGDRGGEGFGARDQAAGDLHSFPPSISQEPDQPEPDRGVNHSCVRTVALMGVYVAHEGVEAAGAG